MKEKIIKWLTVNCACWKDKEKLLNSLSDEELKELKNMAVAKRVTNAAAANFSGAFTTNADGEGEVAGFDYPTLAEFFQIDVDPAKDPVGFTKALKSKLQEVLTALTDSSDPEDAPPPKGDGGADEGAETPTAMAANEDEPTDNGMGDCGPNEDKDKTMATNRNNKPRKLTAQEFRDMMPDEFKGAWTDFVKNSRNERVMLLNKITAGTTGNEKKRLENAHKNMELEDLRIIVKRMGGTKSSNNNGYLPEDNLPTFDVGSGANPNLNSANFDEDDVFEVPTQSFTRKERFGSVNPRLFNNSLTEE